MNNQSHTDQHNQTWVLPMLLLWLMVDVRKPSILASFTVIITYHKPLTRVLSSSTWSDLGTANATTEVDVRKHRRTSSRSNSAGTSDDEVVKESPKKMINMMIGSFWEGWGLRSEHAEDDDNDYGWFQLWSQWSLSWLTILTILLMMIAMTMMLVPATNMTIDRMIPMTTCLPLKEGDDNNSDKMTTRMLRTCLPLKEGDWSLQQQVGLRDMSDRTWGRGTLCIIVVSFSIAIFRIALIKLSFNDVWLRWLCLNQ